MAHLLRIDSGSRVEGSHSRAVADAAQHAWLAAHPSGTVATRDVADGTIPVVAQDTIVGFYTPPEAMTPALRAATALSDRLIAELQVADTLLISAPVYSFGVPASLKLWIDQVVRIGHTFAHDGHAFTGLARPGRAILCWAYGAAGYRPGRPFEAANGLDPYLAFLIRFLGIEDVRLVAVGATTADEATVRAGVAAALDDGGRIAA